MGEAAELLRGIRTQIQGLAGLTKEYLTFTRLPRPRLEEESLNELVEELLGFVRPAALRQGVTVSGELDPLLPLFPFDHDLIRQALLNLVKNALEALPRGGRVTVATRLDGDWAAVSVSDAGPGVPEAIARRLFEPFFTTKPHGTGLGLAITRQFVESERATILVADDEPAVREGLARTLRREGHDVLLAEEGGAALEQIRRGGVDLLLADLRMPELDGLQLLRAVKILAPEVGVILLSGQGTIDEAVGAMKEGADDFLTKPFDRPDLLRAVWRALDRRRLVLENRTLQRRLDELVGAGRILGASPGIRRVLELVEQVAPSSATVLIEGESGTGKELVARAIHEGSPRRGKPFVKVNCAALPETLLESELFGYERGAFTGASARKEGRFDLADEGTLFLDEVADLAPVTQAKLLNVLQAGEFERLGGTRTLKVDVRIVAATNQELAALVRERRFREDLYYRLNVVTVTVPPLRERAEDIPLLAQHFLRVFAARNGKTLEGFTEAALEQLRACPWPGNVRELEHVVERAVVLCRGRLIDLGDLPQTVSHVDPLARVVPIPIGMPLAEVEQRLIEETLRHTKSNKELAAKLLGIASRTIYRKLQERGPSREDREPS
ncbi:MAG: sigma 54-interacting transcriptional regulator [Candidatus Rokubacteria bacterium]|nr:sigma 54-interacting transcriptional regulator [Candidatus Rokubacteria bacterium]